MNLEHFKILSGSANIPEPIRSAMSICTPKEAEAVLVEMGKTMRYDDRREMKQWTGNNAAYEIRAAVSESEFTFVGFDDDGTVMSIFGGRHENLLTDEGIIWELSSERVNSRKFLFAKQSRIGMDLIMRVLHDVEEFSNYVSEEYTSAVRWIEWLGGTVSYHKKFTGRCGGRFLQFTLENPYYTREE